MCGGSSVDRGRRPSWSVEGRRVLHGRKRASDSRGRGSGHAVFRHAGLHHRAGPAGSRVLRRFRQSDVALVHDADGMANSLPESLKQRLVHADFGDVVMRRTHPLAASESPLTAAELAGHAWVASPHGTVCHQWFQRLFAEERNVPDVRHQIDDFSTQLALAATEDLLALIPHLARPPLGPGLVRRALHRPPKREVYAVWRCSSDTSPNIRALLAALSDESLDSASGVVVPG